MPQLRVLIVGASIAGPTAAFWFGKAGAKVTVIERFSQLRTNGQNVDIRTVGVEVMRKIPGMEAAVRAKIMPLKGISFVRADGRPYGTISTTGNPDQQSLVSEYEILRGDLSKILFDMTKENENVNYVFGEQIASMRHQPNDGPVTVTFTNGFPRSDFDLVVACDGGSSRTRALGLGCDVRDHMISTNSWTGYYSTQRDLLEGSELGQAYSAPGGRFIAVGRDSSGVTRVALGGIHPRHGSDALQPFREAMQKGDDALKQFMVQTYKDAGWKCNEALEEIGAAQDFYATEIAQVKTPNLYKGRFVMVGDAGYAPGPTGTGTSLAMAGAYMLAGEVARHKGDISAGLAGYEKEMGPLIHDLQKIPALVLTVLAPQTAWGIWLRNVGFALICWTRMMDFAQRFSAGAFARADKSRLPEYDWAV